MMTVGKIVDLTANITNTKDNKLTAIIENNCLGVKVYPYVEPPKNSFVGLEDTPNKYDNEKHKAVRVNEDENKLEFFKIIDDEELQQALTQESEYLTTHINNKNNPHAVTKTQLGLENVDNTNDLNKPISNATQNALNQKYDAANPNNFINNISGQDLSTANNSNSKFITQNDIDWATKVPENETDPVFNSWDKSTGISITESQVSDLKSYQVTSEKGIANGYAGLDSGAKIPLQNLPATLLKYMGVWNPVTNTPELVSPDLTKIGFVYNVSAVGSRFGYDWNLGDWAIYNESGIIELSKNSDDVVKVNNQTGVVELDLTDLFDVDSTNKSENKFLKVNNSGEHEYVNVDESKWETDGTGYIKPKDSAKVKAINLDGVITSETDPLFTGWDKDYDDLTNKPNIPTNTDFNLSDLKDVDKTSIDNNKIPKWNSVTSKWEMKEDEIGTDEKVKYDVNDTTAGYVADKFIAGTGISLAEGTGADENKLLISNSGIITESDPLSLHLDQTTPQTIINGAPKFTKGFIAAKTITDTSLIESMTCGDQAGIFQINPYWDYGVIFSSVGDNPYPLYNSFLKSRSTNGITRKAVKKGDQLGLIEFVGDTGTYYVGGAEIKAEVIATPGKNTMPTDLIFGTNSNQGVTQRWRLTSIGDWVPKADNQKVYFGAGKDASIYYDGTDLCINTAEVGSGTIKINGTKAVADGTYTVGIGGTQNGTITIKGGIITAVQEAVA